MTDQPLVPAPAPLSELPTDELRGYARRLGLEVAEDSPRGELLRLIHQRQALIESLERDALLDVVVWARRPIRQSAGKEELAERVVQVPLGEFEGLSDRGLEALARLRGVTPTPGAGREDLERRLKKAEGFWSKFRRVRRRVVADWVARALHEEGGSDYHFLPDEQGESSAESVRRQIESEGVVPGLARKLKGVADDYVAEKLDEIERRIDRKLDEIDQRLAEWRDREVANRLRILKITLLVSVFVALICIGYDLVSTHLARSTAPPDVAPTPNAVTSETNP